jgi:hypothetical protein
MCYRSNGFSRRGVLLASVDMASSSELLHNRPAAGVDFDLVRQFVIDADAANLFTESLTFEAKERRHENNVAEAVAALSNTDGGVVLVYPTTTGSSSFFESTPIPSCIPCLWPAKCSTECRATPCQLTDSDCST